jgi:hypothetical protein
VSKSNPMTDWAPTDWHPWMERIGKNDLDRLETLKLMIANRPDGMSDEDYYCCVQARNYLNKKVEDAEIEAEVTRRLVSENSIGSTVWLPLCCQPSDKQSHIMTDEDAIAVLIGEGGGIYD